MCTVVGFLLLLMGDGRVIALLFQSCLYCLAWYLVSGNEYGRGFRDVEMENKVLELTRNVGIGAQFGGKYFCHDVRVVRLPRHGASCPVAIGVSCSADRQVEFCFLN